MQSRYVGPTQARLNKLYAYKKFNARQYVHSVHIATSLVFVGEFLSSLWDVIDTLIVTS